MHITMNHQTRVYNDVFEMLPNEDNPSPMVRINRMNPVAGLPALTPSSNG